MAVAPNGQRQRPTAVDFVLSCSICQDTLSAIYAAPDSGFGLQRSPHNGSGSTDSGAVTKLWLTECAHITCGKHLEGGDQPPKAPCPLCCMNNRDGSPKILYAVRGISKGQYDDNIPKAYLQVPPPQLSDPGNEGLRFQFISLLRFATRIHERLMIAEEELNTWKDRESSIVACLAATEPLTRALQDARSQLIDLHGDISAIDNALVTAANLRGNTIVARGVESISTTNGSRTVLGDQNTPTGSLLARGSAADLQILRDDGPQPGDQRLSRVAQRSGFDDKRSSKRKRPESSGVFETSYQYERFIDRIEERVSSRDTMPPPAQLPQLIGWTNSNRRSVSRQARPLHRAPSEANYHLEIAQRNSFGASNSRCLISNRPTRATEDGPDHVLEHVTPTYPNIRTRQMDDGELDRHFRFSGPSRLESYSLGTSPSRLTLPPSTPSLLNYAMPYRVGISANIRASKPPRPTPANSLSPQKAFHYRPPNQRNQPAASPYFHNLSLANSRAAQSPLIKRPPQQTAHAAPRSYSTINPPIHAPAASVPWKLSWLDTPLRRGQHERQRQQELSTERLQSGSGAYCRPGGHQRPSNGYPASLNSFSFVNQPQFENDVRGSGSQALSESHGRRPARR